MTISTRRTIAEFSNVTRTREVGAIDAMIQPFGCMIVTDAKAQVIEHASENVAASFDATAKEMIGAPTGDHLDATLLHNIRNVAGRPTSSKRPELAGRRAFAGREADVFAHTRNGAIIIELLLVADATPIGGDTSLKVRRLAGDVAAATDVRSIVEDVNTHLLRIFDASRVATLKFTEPGGVAVDGEARKPRVQALANAQFPSDWLAQSVSKGEPSRRIRTFFLNQNAAIGLLGDIEAPPPDIGISLLQADQEQPPDLIGTMEAKSLILCPLVVEGAPWGALALTDVAESALNGAALESLDILARTISLRLEVERKTALLDAAQMASKAALTMVSVPNDGRRLWLEALAELGDHFECDAFAFVDEHEVHATRGAPIALACREIAHRQAGDLGRVRIAEDISTRAAGVAALVAPVSAAPRRSLVFFRTERRARRALTAGRDDRRGTSTGFETDFAWWSRDDVAIAATIQKALVEAGRRVSNAR